MSVAKGAIILIEDVDAAEATADRAPALKVVDGQIIPPPPPASKVSLSGLLNAIDGVAASEDRLLFMTTNHIEKLDDALIRKARIDHRYEIAPLVPEQVGEMARAFFPHDRDGQCAAMDQLLVWTSPRPAAEWQGLFMEMDQSRRPEREKKAA